MDSKMNVMEFSCDLCGKHFHELQGGKCVECNKLLCPSCKDKTDSNVICVNCKRLNWIKEEKHEEKNIINTAKDKTDLDYDEMKHNDRLKYDEDYLKYRKMFDKIDRTQFYLRIIFGFSLVGGAVSIVFHFRYGFDLKLFLYIFGYATFISMIMLANIRSKIEEYFSVERTEDKIPVNKLLEKLRNQNE